MDNNFFANPEWRSAIDQLVEWNQPVDFQGIDVRLLDYEKCMALRKVKKYRQMKIAWDNPKERIDLEIERILEYTFTGKNGKTRKVVPISNIMCYVLAGYNSTHEENLYRAYKLRDMGIDPFIMKYKKDDPYLRALARYVNRPQVFRKKVVDQGTGKERFLRWEEYTYSQGIEA
jgi:hypothetical protein